jgi:heme/copper-type cytochrome/quinol oxidase subunit 2
MKDKDEFLKKMENLQVPEINPTEHPQMVKMAIMNAERSAALGVWLIVVPCYFLLCVFMYYFSHIRVGTSWFAAMFKLMSGLDKTPGIDFLGPIILVVLPIVCIVINALAITHVQYQKHGPQQSKAREVGITIKIKPLNILLILLSLAIVLTFIAYVMTENISVG